MDHGDWERIEARLGLMNDRLDALHADIRAIRHGLRHVLEGEQIIMQDLTELNDAVTEESSVIDSAIVLIDGIAAQLQDALNNGADPAAIQAVVDSINGKKDELAAAVAANTPAEPTPPEA